MRSEWAEPQAKTFRCQPARSHSEEQISMRSVSQLCALGSSRPHPAPTPSLPSASSLCLSSPSLSCFPPSHLTLLAPTKAHPLPQGQADTNPMFLKIVLARRNEYWSAKAAQESTKTTLKPIQSSPINRTKKHGLFGN